MELDKVPKKTQLISLDSRNRTGGTVDNCTFDLHDLFMESLTDVISVRLVHYHVATLRSNTYQGPYVIDIQIPEIPTRGQILDSELGTVFARIPLDRTNSLSTPEILAYDRTFQQDRTTNCQRFFNPVSLPKLNVIQTSLVSSSRNRVSLQSDCGWFMVLEITTIDHEAPREDKLLKAIQDLSRHIKEMPPPQIVVPEEQVKKKIPAWKLFLPMFLVFAGMLWFFTRKPVQNGPALGPGNI